MRNKLCRDLCTHQEAGSSSYSSNCVAKSSFRQPKLHIPPLGPSSAQTRAAPDLSTRMTLTFESHDRLGKTSRSKECEAGEKRSLRGVGIASIYNRLLWSPGRFFRRFTSHLNVLRIGFCICVLCCTQTQDWLPISIYSLRAINKINFQRYPSALFPKGHNCQRTDFFNKWNGLGGSFIIFAKTFMPFVHEGKISTYYSFVKVY